MNKDTVIETHRLLLRSYQLSDVEDLVDGLNNLEVTKWLAAVPCPYTKRDAIYFIQKVISQIHPINTIV